MENYILVICLTALFLQGYAQDSPLEINFMDPNPRHVKAGAQNLEFQCTVNRDVMYIVQNEVNILRQNMGSDGKVAETVLFAGAKRREAEPDMYEIEFVEADSTVNFHVKILTVRDIDDGKLVCRVDKDTEGQSASAEVEIVVVRDLQTLKLKFGNKEPISESMEDPLPVEAGTYEVQCIAEGSNPATQDVNLFLHGQLQTPKGNIVVERLSTDLRRFNSTLTADVEIMAANSGQDLECAASSGSEGGNQLVTKLPIKVNVHDPEVHCNDSEAFESMKYPVLTCTVHHENIPIKQYKYMIGESGETIRDGEQNEEYIQVQSEEVQNGVTKVHLKLYEAKGWHFNTDFYLLIENINGHVTKAKVNLLKIEGTGRSTGPGDDSNVVKSCVATVMLSAILGLFYRLL